MDIIYEDELPEDITDEEYDSWFKLSWVDIVRVGPKGSLEHERDSKCHSHEIE